MNEHEVGRIAAAMNQLRPDWPVKQLHTLLSAPALASRPRRDVCVALAWVACESGTSNPYRVLESGPWWRAVAVDGDTTGRRMPWNPHDFCETCGQRGDHHPATDHEFITAGQQLAKRGEDHEQRRTAAAAYARQSPARTSTGCGTSPTPPPPRRWRCEQGA